MGELHTRRVRAPDVRMSTLKTIGVAFVSGALGTLAAQWVILPAVDHWLGLRCGCCLLAEPGAATP